MQYYRNIDISKQYHVSMSAVTKWVETAEKGKIDLQLHREGSRLFIANTAKNQAVIQELVQERKKYINSRSRKAVRPSPGFYKHFPQRAILDIVSNIEKYREIPLPYTYFNGGADLWDQYAQRLFHESSPARTIQLLALNWDYIASLLAKYRYVNVVDLGAGNCLPIRDMLDKLLRGGQLKRYIAIDASEPMLDIAEHNIKDWFEGRIRFEGHARDILRDRFDDLVAEDSSDDSDTINLVLLLGGTLGNLRTPDEALRVIHHSMGRKDVLLHNGKLDTPNARKFFDFNTSDKVERLAARHKMIPDFLNIDESFYDVEQLFDPAVSSRLIRIRLKVMLSITFELDGYEHTITLDKGEALVVWRYRHQTAFEMMQQFEQADLTLLHANITRDHESIFTVHEVRVGTD